MIRYMILDDEPIAHRIIEGFAEKLPILQKIGNAYDAFEALTILQEKKVDLLFLDMNMPELSGFEFLKTLSYPPKIIITSAHKEFALEGYEFDVVDYLLKPFSFERFLKAINKISFSKTKDVDQTHDHDTDLMYVKSGKKQFQIALKNILFIEAAGNYCKVFLENQTILTLYKISTFEEELPSSFLRVHHSFIVSKDKIEIIEGNQIKINDHMIPVGQTYRSSVNKLFKSKKK
ncbi:LytR/AlgR family response regulator transcription factor [Aquimarina litoralis]|uniref:LytR/AlgR family response regulator transcription factor n=1 Tax=Aquimarina litoralis TaxID=584605 RepID=UPI001C5943DE|nr:LytTR family DNA-binding domain-containing protein [Aquimarina litoralis]MBW1298568.1 response regulator [Aquimarina litoralis]